jgi:hypothetical protein
MADPQEEFPIHRHDDTEIQKESDLFGSGIKPQLPETRRIAIGKKGAEWKQSERGNKYRAPMKLDHFLITLVTLDEKGDYIVDEKSHEVFGPKPKTIPITFLYDRPGLNVHPYLALYAGKTAWCKGDGKKAMRLDKDTGERKQIECPCDFMKTGQCKPHLVVQGHLPTQPNMEVAKFRTTSRHTISYILAGLARVMEITSEFFSLPSHQGILAKIPLNLNLSLKSVSAKDGKTHTIPVVSLSYDGTEAQLEEHAKARMRRYEGVKNYLKKLKLLENAAAAKKVMLLAEDESPEQVKLITEEFHPEAIDDVKRIEQVPAPNDKAKVNKNDAAEFDEISKAADALLDSTDLGGMKDALEPTDADLNPDLGQIPLEERKDLPKPKNPRKKPTSQDESWV